MMKFPINGKIENGSNHQPLICYNVGKTTINHSKFHHFHRWYKPFPVMSSLWHCFTVLPPLSSLSTYNIYISVLFPCISLPFTVLHRVSTPLQEGHHAEHHRTPAAKHHLLLRRRAVKVKLVVFMDSMREQMGISSIDGGINLS